MADGPVAKKSKPKADTLEVICRIKPYDEADPCIELVGDEQLRLIPVVGHRDGNVTDKTFKFSHIFEGYETQRAVFERCGYDLVENLVGGINSLLFTYGVTGSGKTYTMTGDARDDSSGIIPRAVDVLFNSLRNQTPKCVFKPNRFNGFTVQSDDDAAAERARLPPSTYSVYERMMETKKVFGYNREMACSVFVSYVEVYNDQCFDLLDDRTPRQIRTDAKGAFYVEGLNQMEVASSEEVIEQHLRAMEKRRQAATLLNASSSRSHIIFNIRLVMAPLRDESAIPYPAADPTQIVVSQMSLVDLAGSERAKRTENRGEQLVESGKINQSLSVLRRCFDQLRENQRRGTNKVVPYRENELTKLFRSFFEGHGKIRMIICLNPRPDDFKENAFVVTFAEEAQTLGVAEPIAPAPMLCDLASQHYPRRKVNKWYREVEQMIEGASFQSSVSSMPDPPPIQLNGPNDDESMLAMHEYYSSAHRTCEANLQIVEASNADFEMRLMERLCAADLDRARIGELEDEVAELREFNSQVQRQNLKFQRDVNKLRNKLTRYETHVENSARRDEAQRRQFDQQLEALGEQREALRQVADALNDPTTASVSELRKKYSAAAREELEAQQLPTTPRAAPTTRRQVVRDVQTRRVREYVGGGQGVTYNQVGYLNARYGRRSKSCNAVRMLNHEPAIRIPSGAVFQQQFPKNAKHTTQPHPNDLRKCTDYVVTNQDLDESGRLRTECIKGDIIPTAGGGHSVIYKDVERLTQESP